jgi:hypothetical protein
MPQNIEDLTFFQILREIQWNASKLRPFVECEDVVLTLKGWQSGDAECRNTYSCEQMLELHARQLKWLRGMLRGLRETFEDWDTSPKGTPTAMLSDTIKALDPDDSIRPDGADLYE